MLAQLSVQRIAADPQLQRGMCHVPAMQLQRHQQGHFLGFIERVFRRFRRFGLGLTHSGWQVLQPDAPVFT